MIAHIVLFKLAPDVGRDDQRVARFVADMDELPDRIPQIRSWQHGFNSTPDVAAWDYALHALFDDRASLEAYFDHPAHLPVVELWSSIGTLSFCDLEL